MECEYSQRTIMDVINQKMFGFMPLVDFIDNDFSITFNPLVNPKAILEKNNSLKDEDLENDYPACECEMDDSDGEGNNDSEDTGED